MRVESAAEVAKAAATSGVAAAGAFGLTWWALAAALAGAVLSLHFERAQAPSTLWRLLFGIVALGFLAALLAAFTSHLPPILGFSLSEVPIAVRAGLLGLFASPIYRRLRREADDRQVPGG